MAIITTGTYPTAGGGTVYHRRDDSGAEGYTCTGCDRLMVAGSDAHAQDHAATCDR